MTACIVIMVLLVVNAVFGIVEARQLMWKFVNEDRKMDWYGRLGRGLQDCTLPTAEILMAQRRCAAAPGGIATPSGCSTTPCTAAS